MGTTAIVVVVAVVCAGVYAPVSGSIDPYAGSPTKTLLRLLLPTDKKVCMVSELMDEPSYHLPGSPSSPTVGATGGVYKRQGRSQCEMMTHAYGGFLVQVDVTVFYSRQDATFGITFVLVTLEVCQTGEPEDAICAYLLVAPL